MTKADGTEVTVKMDANFAVTGLETGGPGGARGPHGGPGAPGGTGGQPPVAPSGSSTTTAG